MSNRKGQIRQDIRRQRRELDRQAKETMDRGIRERLSAAVQACQEGAVYLYASARGEVDTWQWVRKLWEKGVLTAFPRVEGEEIRFYFASGMEDLAPGAMGILEPLPGRCQLALVTDAPVVTPGLAFSLKGDRLGYGKGYYDRFFLREPRHRRIGVAYPFQIRDDLEPEVQDQKIDEIVTPDGVFTCTHSQGRL
ncbi:MAG: 5-formyltetrahydrofolate cyclo-ligase [Lachnospiraceae bacterium]|nr:5-formyltetrahydrofolate cyclo-ligase [Lachnospiraceae bacterium]